MTAVPETALSLAELVALEDGWEEFLWGLDDEQKLALLHDWSFWARPKQLPPSDLDWRIWFLMTGRGYGKTRSGAEYVRAECEDNPKARLIMVGPTLMDVRETMIEGESGILSICPAWNYPKYFPSRLVLRWRSPESRRWGGRAKGYSADKPDRLRGPNLTGGWGDEWAAWPKPEAWKNIQLALRKGKPRFVLTSTPKVTPQVKALVKRAEKEPDKVRIVRGNTLENKANLSDEFWDIVSDLVGTRMGRQELEGELVEDVEGALFRSATIQRWPFGRPLPALTASVVALDPADSMKEGADEFGIVLAGRDKAGHGYVMADKSGQHRPEVWSRRALDLAKNTNGIVLEANMGPNNLIHTLRTALQPGEKLPQIFVVRAGVNKALRAGPIVELYEKLLIWHLIPFPVLEGEMTTWIPLESTWSPNRMDALVWAFLKLFPNRLMPETKGRDKPPGC